MRIDRSLRTFGLLALASLLCVGCSQIGRAPSGTAPASTARFALAADPQSLDPLFAHVDANSVEQQVARLAFEPFIDVDERGTPVPVLLERIPTVENGGLSRDGRTITYVLRRGVRWQDGVAVTRARRRVDAARDPRRPQPRALARGLRPRRESRGARTTEPCASRSRNRGRPRSRRCSATAPRRSTCCPRTCSKRSRSSRRARSRAHPVGNGPYRFVSWARGDHLVYEANPSYWRGAPKVARLDIRIVPDPGTNFTLLQSGGLDWNLMSPSQRQSLGTPAQLAFRTVPLALVAGIAINVTRPPLDDVRVRRAIAASIDRASISAKITFGRYPVVDTAQPLSSWARDASVHEPAYDPAAADRLLDAAGWKRGADGVAHEGRQTARAHVRAVSGIADGRARRDRGAERAHRARLCASRIKSLSNVQLFLPKSQGGALASGAFDLAYVPWPMGADPDDSFLLSCSGNANYMRWCDPGVDALERRALVAPSREERRRLYAQIERRVADAVPIVYLFNPSYSYAYRTALSGFSPNAFNPTWDAYRWTLTALKSADVADFQFVAVGVVEEHRVVRGAVDAVVHLDVARPDRGQVRRDRVDRPA